MGSLRILKARRASNLPALRFIVLFAILGGPSRKSVKGQLQLTRNVKITAKK